MMIVLFILLNISMIGFVNSDNHAIYISVTNIVIKNNNNIAEVSMKVFSNDLEDAIQNYSGKREKVVERVDFTGLSNVIEEYVNQRTEILLDKKRVLLNVRSCENIGETTWIYLQGEIGSLHESIEVKNQVLFEIFDTQKNIVEINHLDNKYYHSLTKKEPSVKIEL